MRDKKARATPPEENRKKIRAVNGKKETTGKWEVAHAVDPVTDRAYSVATLQASQGRSSLGEKVSLILQCDAQDTILAIRWADLLDTDRLTIRVNDDKAEPTNATRIENNQTSTLQDASANEMVARLRNAWRFVVRTSRTFSATNTAIFHPLGIEAVLEQLSQNSCPSILKLTKPGADPSSRRLPADLSGKQNTQICGQALNGEMKDWSLAGYQREYVEEAKRRSLTPDACRIIMTMGEPPSSWSNLSLCRESLNWRGTGWITAKDKRPFLEEIEKRGLSPKLCRGYVTRAN